MVGTGILSRDDDHLGLVKVLKLGGAFSDTQGFPEGGSTSFMAHVRTVGHIVRSESPGEHPIEVGRLVTGTSRSVKYRLIG